MREPLAITLALVLALPLVPAASASVSLTTSSIMHVAATWTILVTPGPTPHALTLASASDAVQRVHVRLDGASGAASGALTLAGTRQVTLAAGRAVQSEGVDVTLAPHATLALDGTVVGGVARLVLVSHPASDAGARLEQPWSVGR